MKNPTAKTILSAALLLTLAFSARAQLVINHWSGAAADRNWATAGNWDNNAAPVATDDVLFDIVDGQPDFTTNNSTFATNNFLSQDFTIRSLTYSNWTYTASSPNYLSQHTVIGDGVTLTVTNGMIVGVSRADGKGFTATPATYAAISGAGGTLAITGSNVAVGYQSSESAAVYIYALMDMSGLGYFTYTNSVGTFGIAAATHRRQGGEVFLARTNLIIATNMIMGMGATAVGTHAGLIHFGQNTTVNANNVIFAKDSEGHGDFTPGLTNPVIRIRGQDGASAVNTVYMGWTTSSGSSWGYGTNDFTAGTIDLAATNLTVSLHAGDVSGATQTTRNSFLIGSSAGNSVVVQNLVIGSDPGTATATKTSKADGTIDMQGGTFSAGPVTLGTSRNSTTGLGTINIHGGTFTASSIAFATTTTPVGIGASFGNFLMSGGSASIAGDWTVGGGTAACAITNATLAVGGKIGTASSYFSSVTLNQATLQLTPDNSLNVCAYVTALDIEGSNTVVITNQNLSVSQFPLIVYGSAPIGAGVAGLGVNVPAGVTAHLVDNTVNSSIDLVVTGVSSPAAQPVTGNVSLSGNIFSISGTGTPNQPYHLYATTNLSLPVNQWTLLGTTNATGGGVIQFFDQTTNTQRFYELGR